MIPVRQIAEVPTSLQASGIRWLILETDPEDTKGAFLYLHKSLEEPCEFDQWYESVGEAKRQASAVWGVAESEWRSDSEK